MELKSTLNLPRTDFSMKANLPLNEPKILARWEAMGLYGLIRQARSGPGIGNAYRRFCQNPSFVCREPIAAIQ